MTHFSVTRSVGAAALLSAGILSARYQAVDVTPPAPGSTYYLYGGTSAQQIGIVRGPQFPNAGSHAVLLSGNGAGVVDLQPTSLPLDSPYFTLPNATILGRSIGYATDGITQAGVFINTAVMWTGTPDSMVNLHPSQYLQSAAVAVRGSQQAGWASIATSKRCRPKPISAGRLHGC